MSVKDNYSEGLVLEGLLVTLDIFNCLAVRKCFLVDLSPQYFSVPRDALELRKHHPLLTLMKNIFLFYFWNPLGKRSEIRQYLLFARKLIPIFVYLRHIRILLRDAVVLGMLE